MVRIVDKSEWFDSRVVAQQCATEWRKSKQFVRVTVRRRRAAKQPSTVYHIVRGYIEL